MQPPGLRWMTGCRRSTFEPSIQLRQPIDCQKCPHGNKGPPVRALARLVDCMAVAWRTAQSRRSILCKPLAHSIFLSPSTAPASSPGQGIQLGMLRWARAAKRQVKAWGRGFFFGLFVRCRRGKAGNYPSMPVFCSLHIHPYV